MTANPYLMTRSAPVGVTAVAAVFVLALGLRLGGIAFGLPYVFHPDEPRHVVEAVNLMSGSADALSFENPALYRYLLVAVFGLVIGQARLIEVDQTGVLYLLARATSAVAGAVTVLTVYWLAQMVRGHRAGIIAGCLAAGTLLLVRESHFGTNDALGALGSSVALAASVLVARRGRPTDYLFAGLSLGLAFAAKYQAGLVAVPLVFAHVRPGRPRHDSYLLLTLGASLVTALVAFPPLATETRRVIGDIWVNIVLPSRLGWEGLDRTPGYGYEYYLKVLAWSLGWPALLLAVVGAGLAARTRDWPVLTIVSLPLVVYAVLGGSRIFFARYLLPAVPPLIVLAAVALDRILQRAPILGAGLTVLAITTTLPNSLTFDALLTRTDTRDSARDWVQANVPLGKAVLAEGEAEGPPLEGLPQTVVHPDGALFDVPLSVYRQQGIVYVITSSYTSEAPNIDPERNARRLGFYAALESTAQKVAEFRAYRGAHPDFVYDRLFGPLDSLDQFDQPGPTIAVYRLSAE